MYKNNIIQELLQGMVLKEKPWPNLAHSIKYPRCDSNAQPTAPQAVALSIKLRGLPLQALNSIPYRPTGQGHAGSCGNVNHGLAGNGFLGFNS